MSDKIHTLNTHNVIKTKVEPPYRIYGFAVDETNSDPENAVTYIEDCVGFTPATNSVGNFDGGSWLDKFPFNQIRVVALNGGTGSDNGTISTELDKNNFKKTITGEDRESFFAMIEIPPVYWKFTTTSTGYEVRFSSVKIDDSYEAKAHSRGDTLKGNLYVSAYEGYVSNDKIRSQSGQRPSTGVNITNCRTYASNVGTSGWGLMNFQTITLLQILFVTMFKSLDSQKALGNGISSHSLTNTGTLDLMGMYYGDPAATGTAMKFMGIENLWGNTDMYLDGIHYNGKLRINDGSVDYSQYTSYPIVITQSALSNGYTSKTQGTQEGGFAPKEVAGSSSSFYCDTGRLNKSYPIATYGGSYSSGVGTGIFYINVYWGETESYNEGGARLQYLAP